MTINVREPWAVYELDGDSTDATGNQGTLEQIDNPNMGILGQGATGIGQNLTLTEANFLFTGSSSFGFWYNITAGDLTWSDGDGLTSSFLGSDPDSYYFNLGCDGTNIILYLHGSVSKDQITSITAAGWHHFAFTRVTNSIQFFVDGVAVGTPSDVVPGSDSGGSDQFTIGLSEGSGIFDQPVFAEVAYTAEEWDYIYNSGVGRLYVDWNPVETSIGIASFGSGGGFGNLSHGNGFN